MRQAFGKAIVRIGERDPAAVVITGDVVQNMDEFIERWPDRFYNMGLCEQTMISAAAGMAAEGLRPIVYSITSFLLERAFEQIKIDVDAQNLPVMLVGFDSYPTHGITHRPLDTCALIGCFRNLEGHYPTDPTSAEAMLLVAYLKRCPTFVHLTRYEPPFF